MTREEWLRHALEKIDEVVFGGSLGVKDLQYQIACGWTKHSKAMAETIYAYDGEDVTLDDFFPTTIHVNVTTKDPVDMIGALVHECIHAFKGIKKHGKDFAKEAKKVGFEKPFTKYYPNEDLKGKCLDIYQNLVREFGAFPGKPVVLHPKEKKQSNNKSIVAFCPTCGYTFKIPKKMFNKYEGKFPTCPCGTKMAQDLDEQESED